MADMCTGDCCHVTETADRRSLGIAMIPSLQSFLYVDLRTKLDNIKEIDMQLMPPTPDHYGHPLHHDNFCDL